MTYNVEISRKALKDLQSLPKREMLRIATEIEDLGRDPRPFGSKKLAGDEVFYRIRVGDYRIIYEIQNPALVVLVVQIGHRKDIYNVL